ncbi:MAG: hypothetical protein RLY97_1319 [Pseudomonadota bacterium]|jgi:DnaJ homolog subfamily C member 19
MAKLIWILAFGSLGCKWLLGRWPWEMLGEMMALKPRSPGLARARALLGVVERASREDIIAAHRALLVQIHPDRGGSDALVHEANDARDVLLGELAARG